MAEIFKLRVFDTEGKPIQISSIELDIKLGSEVGVGNITITDNNGNLDVNSVKIKNIENAVDDQDVPSWKQVKDYVTSQLS